MIKNFFPTIKQIDRLYKRHIVGFTNGKTIFTNLYTGALKENDISKDLNIIYTHELIHTIDMDLSEDDVIFATKSIFRKI